MTRCALSVSLLLLAVLLAQAACCQDHGRQARDITGQPEYSGYRVRSHSGPGSGTGASGQGGGGTNGQGGNGQGGGNPGEGNPGEGNPREGNPDEWQPVEEGDRADWKAPDTEAGEWKPDRPDDAWGKPKSEGFKRETTMTGPEKPQSRGSGPRSSGGGGGGGGGAFAAFLGTVFQVVMWVVLVGAALVALFFIIKALIGIRFNKRGRKAKAGKKKKAEAAKAATDTPATDAIDTPELPKEFEDALVVARRELADALAQRDYARATMLRYRVFWLEAGWRGCVEQADVRTWRDALRMARKEARGQLRPSLTLVERVRYGDYQPGANEYDQWQSQLQLVEPRGVIA